MSLIAHERRRLERVTRILYQRFERVFLRRPIEAIDELVVPSLTIYEVFKRVLEQRDESHALRAVAVMQQGAVVDLDVRVALSAARLSLDTRLPMADSVVLGTARLHQATL